MSLNGFKIRLQNNPVFRKPYYVLKGIKDKRVLENQFKYRGVIEKRSKNSDTLCIVLAGYKEFLYDDVFGRIKSFIPDGIDVCIITSGKYSDIISKTCKEQNWSYLSTEENNVCLVQNVAIKEHPDAKYIFKLDEDMFITDGFFEKMKDALETARNSSYNPGVIAPLIPINGYGYVHILEKLNLIDVYTMRFEKPIIAAGPERMIESKSEAAMFFWGKDDFVPSIDKLNEMFSREIKIIEPCAIRFSIGAILFERELIEEMGFFPVERATTGMAQDEIALCTYCCLKSRPIMVSKNVVVGHFSFGPQTKDMKEYYTDNREKFRIND